MELKPLTNYKNPKLPTIREIETLHPHPGNTSKRTRKNTIASIILSSILLSSMPACGKSEPISENEKPVDETPQNALQNEKKEMVAPVFIHGDGKIKLDFNIEPIAAPKITLTGYSKKTVDNTYVSGLTFKESPKPMLLGNMPGGTLPTASDPYLHEADALSIIKDELQKADIHANETINIVSDSSFKWSNVSSYHKEFLNLNENSSISLFDGFDKSKKIGFEYVSIDDMLNLGLNPVAVEKENASKDFLETTQDFRSVIADHTGDSYTGLFYDPGNSSDDINERHELLRKQVRDFIDWLKK
ncbi:MAG TPA: hypothetical protein VIO64_09835 [Pseudobacteroides sp.]|uniref:hypothetical protein n=1 Tax=Pseudobacteroides sp. TaxID=1968840 RepID=UPI002F9208AB